MSSRILQKGRKECTGSLKEEVGRSRNGSLTRSLTGENKRPLLFLHILVNHTELVMDGLWHRSGVWAELNYTDRWRPVAEKLMIQTTDCYCYTINKHDHTTTYRTQRTTLHTLQWCFHVQLVKSNVYGSVSKIMFPEMRRIVPWKNLETKHIIIFLLNLNLKF
jgi:hypothetical protein